MKFNSPAEWFGSKAVGWGIRPVTWEGWAVLALLIVLIAIVISVV